MGAPRPAEKLDPLGTLIRERRVELALTQQDLADRLDLSQNYVSAIESTLTVNPDASLLTLLAKALRVPLARVVKAAAARGARSRAVAS